MRESMARLTPRFSADRTVKEYTEKHYLPAAKAYKKRVANNGKEFKQIIQTYHELKNKWSGVRFGETTVKTDKNQYEFDVQVYLNNLENDSVKVELYADNNDGGEPVHQEMSYVKDLSDKTGWKLYHCKVKAGRQVSDYTPRIIPHSNGFTVPLENDRITWER